MIWQAGCQNETEIEKVERILSQMNTQLEKLKVQYDSLERQISDDALLFTDIKSTIDSNQELALLDMRLSVRNTCIEKIISKLQKVFGSKFDFQRFHNATDQIDDMLAENPDIFHDRSLYLRQEREQIQGKERQIVT